jgi:riboflavin synthase
MFTGIIQAVGTVAAVVPQRGDLTLQIDATGLSLDRARLGDSIAVNGVCLTVTALGPGQFSADVSRETLAITTLGGWQLAQRVNLEAALRLGEALGGHLVAGHVDGVAEVLAIATDARSTRVRIGAPAALRAFLARKGSVTLDGVSLTVNDLHADGCDVNLVPHTLAVTTLGDWRVGVRVNIEVDLMARYAARLMTGGDEHGTEQHN